MTKRMTWVGIAPCGHASFVAADPEHVIGMMGPARERMRKFERVEADLDEYKTLVDQLRFYAEKGQIKLVDDQHLGEYTDQMKTCGGEHCPRANVAEQRWSLPTQTGDKKSEEVANFIVNWLRDRNGGELRDAFDDMRVRDLKGLLDELSLILRCGGRPPNWVP